MREAASICSHRLECKYPGPFIVSSGVGLDDPGQGVMTDGFPCVHSLSASHEQPCSHSLGGYSSRTTPYVPIQMLDKMILYKPRGERQRQRTYLVRQVGNVLVSTARQTVARDVQTKLFHIVASSDFASTVPAAAAFEYSDSRPLCKGVSDSSTNNLILELRTGQQVNTLSI